MEQPTHYVLVQESGVFVKDAEFFVSQGGLREPWGRNWEPVMAGSLYAARNMAIAMRRQRWPNCHLTMGERGENPEDYWPEARGA